MLLPLHYKVCYFTPWLLLPYSIFYALPVVVLHLFHYSLLMNLNMNMLISILNNLIVHYMSGTSGMLPSQFNYQPKSITKRVHQAEKPVELLEEIIGYISLPYEIILDQFAGSSNLAVAALNMSRNAIVIEGVENI